MAFAAWTSETAFSVGDVRRAASEQSSGLVFRCTVAGTSGASEPAPWPVVRGLTIEDGTVTWEAVSAVGEELNKLAPSSIIELFELDATASSIGDTVIRRFHSGVNQQISGDIVWNGRTYNRYAIQADGFKYDGQGQLPRPTVTISNTLGLATALIIDFNDLVGAKVTRIRTLKKYLDAVNFTSGTNATADPYAEFAREIYIIDRKTLENREVVSFELAAAFDIMGVQLPRRQIIQNICPWTYRGEGCGYAGLDYFDIDDNPTTEAFDVCSHKLSGCKARFGENNQLPYGGFPAAGLF